MTQLLSLLFALVCGGNEALEGLRGALLHAAASGWQGSRSLYAHVYRERLTWEQTGRGGGGRWRADDCISAPFDDLPRHLMFTTLPCALTIASRWIILLIWETLFKKGRGLIGSYSRMTTRGHPCGHRGLKPVPFNSPDITLLSSPTTRTTLTDGYFLRGFTPGT